MTREIEHDKTKRDKSMQKTRKHTIYPRFRCDEQDSVYGGRVEDNARIAQRDGATGLWVLRRISQSARFGHDPHVDRDSDTHEREMFRAVRPLLEDERSEGFCLNVCAKKHRQGDRVTWRQGDNEHRNGESVSKGE